MFSIRNRMILIVLLAIVLAGPALAQTYDLSWRTIDGGGVMGSVGGAFALSGTIGQPDAGSFSAPMTDGTFQLVGGFWPGTAGQTCPAVPGDMNVDGAFDGDDAQIFVNCVLGSGGASCACADLNGSGTADSNDVGPFVSLLLN